MLVSAVFEGSSWLSTPPLRTYIAHVSEGKSRGTAYSFIVSSIALAGIPAPVLGGFLIQWFGYPVIFLLAGLIFVISTFFLLPISSIPHQQTESQQTRQQKYFSNRIFLLSTVFMAIIVSLSFFTRDFIPLFLEDVWGLQEDIIGILIAIFNGSAVLVAPLIGVAGDRVGYTKILPLPIVGLLGSLGLLVIAPSFLWLYPIFALRGTFFGVFSLVNALVSKHLSQGQLQKAFTTYTFLQRLPSPITPLLGGMAYGLDPSLPFVVSALLIPLPLIINILLYREEKHPITEVQNEQQGHRDIL
jgi:predicted MFS family arabinose efflux permease